jgi:hypothetical protein
VRSYLELLEQAEEFIGDEYPTIELRTRFTDYWIEAINVLLDSDLGLTKAKVGSAFFWEGSGLQSDATIEYTKAGTDRLQGWLKVWVALYHLGESAPTFAQLKNDDATLSTMIDNIFRENRPVFLGMRKIATSRLSAGTDDDAIKEEAQNLLKSRYNHLRKRATSK